MSHGSFNATTFWDSVKVADPNTGVEYAYLVMQTSQGNIATTSPCDYHKDATTGLGSYDSFSFVDKKHFDSNHADDLFSHLNGQIQNGDYISLNPHQATHYMTCLAIKDKITLADFNNGLGTSVNQNTLETPHGTWTGCPCTIEFKDITVMSLSTSYPSPFAVIYNDCASCQGQGLPSVNYGCTDSTALNYDPSAAVNQVSATDASNPCLYPVPGCTDSTALNYNVLATVDNGTCAYSIPGCTDSTAQNYNASANIDDGSCVYCVYGCMNPNSTNFNPYATCDNGSCIKCINGCMNPGSSNYNVLATCDDGSCAGCIYGCTDSNSSNYNVLATCDDGSCCVDGCTNPKSLNYNVLATCDDGSCKSCIYGCTDTNAMNYDSEATCDDGKCLEGECSDCFKLLNVLYNEAKCEGCTEDDYMVEEQNLQRFTNLRLMRDLSYSCGESEYLTIMQAEEYELCSTLLDEHTNEKVNDYKVYGCTNPSSLNYNSNATHPCEKNGILNFCCGDTSTLKVSGCTDPLATNYNPSANIDDGLCTY